MDNEQLLEAVKKEILDSETRLLQYMAQLDERQTRRTDVLQDLVAKFLPAALEQMKDYTRADSMIRLQVALIEVRLAKLEGEGCIKMAILRLENDKPYTFALRYKAKQRDGQFGREFQYFFVGGDTTYLPPVAHAEIESLHLDLGDRFSILKSQEPTGAFKYSVERIAQPKPMARAESVVRENRTPEIHPPELTTPQSQHVFRQLVATLQAVKAAEEFSISIDRPVKFQAEDIRALAISSFIEQSRRAA